MPRRIYTYPSQRGWDFWNAFATVGSFVIAVSVLVFMWNVWRSRKGPIVAQDPWDARTLEWTIPNPPPEYNFAEIPIVTARDDFWHQKYEEDDEGRARPRRRPEAEERAEVSRALATGGGEHAATVDVEGLDEGESAAGDSATAGTAEGAEGAAEAAGDEGAHGEGHADADGHGEGHADADGHGEGHADGGGHGEGHGHIHMPSPSYWPIMVAIGLGIIPYGIIYKFLPVAILGGAWLLGSIYAWALEPATAPDEPEEPTPSTSTDLEPVSVG